MKLPRRLTERLDEADEKVLKDVENNGWHVIVVSDEGREPGWGFSVGLYYTFRHPEVVIFGLPREVKYAVINTIGENVRIGKRYQSGIEAADILSNEVPCFFQTVEKSWYEHFLGYARWFYENDSFPVLQCFWPDKQGNYPWDQSFNAKLFERQPLLFHVDPVRARVQRS
jgi:hypothetical protein